MKKVVVVKYEAFDGSKFDTEEECKEYEKENEPILKGIMLWDDKCRRMDILPNTSLDLIAERTHAFYITSKDLAMASYRKLAEVDITEWPVDPKEQHLYCFMDEFHDFVDVDELLDELNGLKMTHLVR